MKSLKPLSGLSLIELMISLTIGLFLSFGLVTVFITGKMTYVTDEESALMQENSRYALRFIARELSMSSFMGGLLEYNAPPISLAVDCGASNWATTTTNTVEVVDNWSSGTSLTSIGTTLTCLSDMATNSDVITIKRTADEASGSTVGANQLYLRSENYGATQTFEYPSSSINNTDPEVEYWEYQPKVIFVRSYSNSASDAIPTLCVAGLTNNSMQTDCLAEGVEAIQIEFGIDSDSDGVVNYYVTAPTSVQAEQTISAKIHVLMRSISTVPSYTNDTVYALGSTEMNGGEPYNDGFQRRAYSSSVKLRNPITL